MAGGLTRGRRLAAAAVVLAVVLVHVGVVEQVRSRLVDLDVASAAPARFKVSYVRELEFARPPVVAALPQLAPVAPRRVRPLRELEPLAVATAASAAEPVDAAASAADEAASAAVAAASQPASAASTVAAASADAAVEAASAAASAAEPDVVWPQSTRVEYTLAGNYRGEIAGTAQVEWARAGADRYQVHLDVTVGLPFAPLLTRSMNSEGRITPQGLYPERFDQDSKLAFRDRQRGTQRFEAEEVVMFDGRRLPRPRGLQDTTSQFIQLAYLFTRHPELAQPGRSIQLPLVLPRRIADYVYDVIDIEPVYTAFGDVEAIHLKPRRAEPTPGELSIEIWFAPSLRNLPVRIKLRQDDATYIDLVISRKPELGS